MCMGRLLPPAWILSHPPALLCRLPADNEGQPLDIINGFYQGDRFRPYLPAINPNVTDSAGRPFPGNTAEAAGQQAVVCSSNGTVRVRIIDSCPCTQVSTHRGDQYHLNPEMRVVLVACMYREAKLASRSTLSYAGILGTYARSCNLCPGAS
jgi:hypothetical protein